MVSRIPVLNKRTDSIPEGAIYIGRPSFWGNPFSHLPHLKATTKVRTREEAVERYREYAAERIVKDGPDWLAPLKTATALVCWCKPLACHGDYLAEVIQRWVALEEATVK